MYVNINMNKRLRVVQSFKNQFLLIRHAASIYKRRDNCKDRVWWAGLPTQISMSMLPQQQEIQLS